MKKKLFTLVLPLMAFSGAQAQEITDTVSLGAGYTNQVWYSLENDEQGTSPKNNWDLAFDCSGYGASIRINSVTGTKLWTYPSGTTAAWTSLDTTGLSTWTPAYNSDTSWTYGAFDMGTDATNSMDLGWGTYSTTTHIVTGDSLYIIKLSDASFRKLWIVSLSAGVFTFQYANLDGTNQQTATFTKANYVGKTLGYYSLQNNTALNREPLAADWDLTFCQYTGFIPSPYTLSGILTNTGTTVAQVNNVGNTSTFASWESQSYVTAINEIGYDWKTFTGTAYEIADSTVYFVKTNAGDVWKVIATGFGGGSNGNMIFTKEKLASARIKELDGSTKALFSIFPNPTQSGIATILYDLGTSSKNAKLFIQDASGKILQETELISNGGFTSYQLDASSLNAGAYFITLVDEGSKMQQKLIIQ